MLIHVDLKEQSNSWVKYWLQKYAQVEWETLPLGDIETEETIIERKSFKDYVYSLADGRLFDQLNRMYESEKACFMIVHDEEVISTNVTEEQIYGAMASQAVRYGVPIYWFLTIQRAMYVAVKICEKVHEGKFGVPRKQFKRKLSKAPFIVQKTARYLGVPEMTATSLLAKFGSIENICKAQEIDLYTCQGVGEIRAKRIMSMLKHDWRKKP